MINASFDDVNEINFRVKVNFSKSEILDENMKWVRCEIIHKGKIMTLKRKLLPWDCLVLKLYS